MKKSLLLIALLSGICYARPHKPMFGSTYISQRSPVSKGIVGAWLAYPGKTVFDLSGNNNHGTFNQSAAAVDHTLFGEAWWCPGNVNGLDRITIADSNAYSGLDLITLSFWVNMPTLAGAGDYEMMVGKANWADNREFRFRGENNAFVTWQISNDGADPGAAEATYALSNFSTNTWYHLVGTYDGTTLAMYVDGFLVDTTAGETGGLKDGTAALCFGSSSNGDGDDDDNFVGYIDHVVIWDRALSATEVKIVHDNPFCIYGQGLEWLPVATEAPASGGGQVIVVSSLPYIFPLIVLSMLIGAFKIVEVSDDKSKRVS